ncbi:hypothetical protein [uncultured Sphingomonas sp.]|uniref:hypothetical protein n=1 Tax=uncultured Sphingomonas sp. TaxID=158754 RepID=UPI0035CB2109
MTTAVPATPRRKGRPWLASPGRFAGLGRRSAQAWLAIVAVLMLVALIAARAPTADPIDAAVDSALADGVRHGGDFYAVATDTAQGSGLPASVRTIPLPTLSVIEGQAPAPLASAAMMLLAVLVVLAWYAGFGDRLTGRRARAGALLLMLLGMAITLRPALVAVPEGWAGLLVALSLARAAPGRTVEPAALGLAATMLTPAALPYALVMLLAAWRTRSRQAAAGWAVVILAGVVAVALNARALGIVVPAGADHAAPDGLGVYASLASFGWATGLRALPSGLALPLVVLAIAGWATRREPVALSVLALIVLEAALIAALEAPNAALIVAPLLPLGLLAVPDALRALSTAALDRRRITVTRVERGGLVR